MSHYILIEINSTNKMNAVYRESLATPDEAKVGVMMGGPNL
jgi:hypothetical protein